MSIDITLQTNVYQEIYQEMKYTGKHLSTMIFIEEANLNLNLKMLVFQE